jgi:hypothetical protein
MGKFDMVDLPLLLLFCLWTAMHAQAYLVLLVFLLLVVLLLGRTV